MFRPLVFVALLICVGGTLWADAVIGGYGGATDNPQTAGYHKLSYTYTADGKQYSMPFMLYLPEGYGVKQQSWPMLVFLSGLGERGDDSQAQFRCGVAHDLATSPEVLKWMPGIILMPQCPWDREWKDEHIARAVLSLTDEVAKRWHVEDDRVSITGVSGGGTGVWSVAKIAPRRFSVIVPIVARAFEPDSVAAALTGSGTTCLLISGLSDTVSEPASSQMASVLGKIDLDLLYAPVPGGGHMLFTRLYADRRFYEWVFSHKRGAPRPAGRMTPEGFIAIASGTSPNAQREERLTKELRQIAPWWHLDNCGEAGEPGLHKELAGKKDVFVTYPAAKEVPCRLQFTTKLSPSGKGTLHLVVGRHADGDWSLSVCVNEQEVYHANIDKASVPQQWKTVDIDLGAHAGQEVRLQLVHSALNAKEHEEAYWEAIKIVQQ